MKQSLAFILSLLALSLCLSPCTEAPLEISEATSLVVDAGHCTSSEAGEASCPDKTPEDPCDPGCSCFCCAPLVLSLPVSSLSFVPTPLPAEVEFYRSHFLQGFSEDIWQPPRMS